MANGTITFQLPVFIQSSNVALYSSRENHFILRVYKILKSFNIFPNVFKVVLLLSNVV